MEKQAKNRKQKALIQFWVSVEDKERGDRVLSPYETLASFARKSYFKDVEARELEELTQKQRAS